MKGQLLLNDSAPCEQESRSEPQARLLGAAKKLGLIIVAVSFLLLRDF